VRDQIKIARQPLARSTTGYRALRGTSGRSVGPAMISSVNHDDSSYVVFGHLLAFLNRLDEANISYRLGHTRPESVMVEIALPGWHWEVEFLADGAVEIERYRSVGDLEDWPELLEESSLAFEAS
jgi:hypothetical protein